MGLLHKSIYPNAGAKGLTTSHVQATCTHLPRRSYVVITILHRILFAFHIDTRSYAGRVLQTVCPDCGRHASDYDKTCGFCGLDKGGTCGHRRTQISSGGSLACPFADYKSRVDGVNECCMLRRTGRLVPVNIPTPAPHRWQLTKCVPSLAFWPDCF